MKLILEGPDNAGKTTLANHLLKELKESVTYYHPGGKPENLDHETKFCIEQVAMLNTHNIILDRITPISQRVYNPDPMTDLVRMKFIAEMRFKNPVFLYCRPSTDRLMRVDDFTWREGESEEHKQKIIQNQHVFIDRYDKVMSAIPHITYDFEDPNSVIVLHKLVLAFQGDPNAQRWLNELVNNGSRTCM